jgi:hypothetical protein
LEVDFFTFLYGGAMEKIYYSESQIRPLLENSVESTIAKIDLILSEKGLNRVCTDFDNGVASVLCEKDEKLYLAKIKDSKICECAPYEPIISEDEFFGIVAEEFIKNPAIVTEALSAELD